MKHLNEVQPSPARELCPVADLYFKYVCRIEYPTRHKVYCLAHVQPLEPVGVDAVQGQEGQKLLIIGEIVRP